MEPYRLRRADALIEVGARIWITELIFNVKLSCDSSDVFVVSAALTTATEGLIGARELGLMKENAILINVARGEIIDEGALYAHLVSHPHFFAGIDAWWVEPVRHGHFAMGYPFLDLPNVIGSPHNSAGGGAWRDEYLRRAVQNCRRAILGETPRNLIGPDERML